MAQISNNDIAKAIEKLSESAPSSKLPKMVASYLISNRRTADLDKIMRQIAVIRLSKGLSEVTITSAVPINSEIKKQIKSLIKSKSVLINEVNDKSVIGGVRIEANEYYLDLTVRNRLNKLKVGV